MLSRSTLYIVLLTSWLLLWARPVLAGQVQLAWDVPTMNTDGTHLTDLAGYCLYYWQENDNQQRIDVGPQTTYTVTGLQSGATYTFVVTAYTTAGMESGASNVLMITASDSQHAPVAVADAAVTYSGVPVVIAVLANDTTAEGHTLRLTDVTQATHGTVIHNGDTVTYTPATTFAGTDSFTYSIEDSWGAAATATVTVTVIPRNHAPVAGTDTVATAMGAAIVIAVLANDTDADGNPLTITAVTQGVHGTVTIHGTTISYVPATNFAGTDHFTYTITDGLGGTVTGTVQVTVFVMLQLEAEAGTFTSPMRLGTDAIDPSLRYAWVSETTPSVVDPLAPGGYVQYSFVAPKTDTYVIWGRTNPATTGTGSFFLGVDVPAQHGFITNVSPETYQVATLRTWDRYYVDSGHVLMDVPPALQGLTLLKTAKADRRNRTGAFLPFTLLHTATVYIAYDARVTAFPNWLTQYLTNTGQVIGTSNGPMAVWKKDAVPAGTYTLPGNAFQVSPAEPAQYFVLFDFHGAEPYLVWDITASTISTSTTQPWLWSQAALQTTPVFFLQAGLHTLSIRQRESGSRLDKLIITNKLDLVPGD